MGARMRPHVDIGDLLIKGRIQLSHQLFAESHASFSLRDSGLAVSEKLGCELGARSCLLELFEPVTA